jgi:signal transduction histidine kinase
VTTSISRRIADAIVVASLALLVASPLLTRVGGDYRGNNSYDVIYIPMTFFGAGIYLWVGRMIVSRQPSNSIGWLLLAIPFIASFALANGAYATRALVIEPGSLPFGRASAWFDRWLIVPMLAAFIPIFLVYPNGRLPSRRWRPILWLVVAAPTVATIAFALTPGRMTGAMADLEHVRVTNPLGVSSAASLVDAVTVIGGFAVFGSAIAAGVAIIVRYRVANGEVRQQVRWLASVAAAFFAEVVIGIVGTTITHDSNLFGNVLFLVLNLTLIIGTPVACGIAILKYHLYDLDVVVRKTVVFGLLAVFIAVVYAAVVGGIGALVGTRANTLLSFLAAAVLAVAFQPARDRARRLADRVVYGRRATPYEVLAQFSDRMSETFATEDVLPRMAEILRAGTGAEVARVWLRIGTELRPEASTGGERIDPVPVSGAVVPEIPSEHAVEVRHQGELLGALSVRMPASDPMNPARDKLVRDLAGQAGLVLRNVKLIEDLRSSRQRLVAAQDEERRKIERNLHDGAQQQLVALSVKLRLADQLVERDASKARKALGQMQSEVTDALENLRDLARGIYPPLLADQGLGAALEAQARKSPVQTTVEPDGVGRYAAEIEATVYFCALEALQNVAKYADASAVTVRLRTENGALVFEVSDNGRGFDPASTGYGTGLQGMADRLDAVGGSLEVRSSVGVGTTVTGTLPFRPEAGVS